jgi:hypothetical protein
VLRNLLVLQAAFMVVYEQVGSFGGYDFGRLRKSCTNIITIFSFQQHI